MTIPVPTPVLSWHALIIGTGGGLASLVMFYSAFRGTAGLGMVLLPLMPLPTLIAGLGWGVSAALAAVLAGTIGVAATVSPTLAIGYLLALGVPAIGIAHLVSLARHDAAGTVTDWYPAGRLLAAIALYGAALPVLILAIRGGSFDVLAPDLTRLFKQMAAQAPIGSFWRAYDEPRIQSLVQLWVHLMPAVFASYWTLFIAINVYLAGTVVRLSGLLHRPWPDLHWLTCPRGLLLLLALALVGIGMGGGPRVIGTAAIGALAMAYLLQGLAVVHAIGRPKAAWLMSAVYAALVIGSGLAVPLIALLGVVEAFANLRQRFTPVPPGLPSGSL